MKKLLILTTFLGIALGVFLALDEKGVLRKKLGVMVEGIGDDSKEDSKLTEYQRKRENSTDNTTQKNTKTKNKQTNKNNKKFSRKTKKTPTKKAKTKYKEAFDAYKKGHFSKCISLTNSIRANDSSMRMRIEDIREKSTVCKRLIKDIKRNKRMPNKITRIEMVNGKEYVGTVLSENSKQVRIKVHARGRMVLPLPKYRIQKRQVLTRKKYRAKLLSKFQNQARQLSPRNPANALKLIKKGVVNNMLAVVARTLYELEKKDPQAGEKLLNYKAGLIYRKLLWCQTMGKKGRAREYLSILNKEFPGSRATKLANTKPKPRPKPKPLIAMNKKQSRSNAGNKHKRHSQKKPPQMKLPREMQKGNRFYNSGYAHLKKSFPGEPNSDRELKLAKADFRKAVSYYEIAQKKAPGNQIIQAKLQQASEYLYHCIKQSRLGF